MEQLLKEYRKSLKAVNNLREQLKQKGNSPEVEKEKSIVNGMASSLTHAMKWMKTGRNPDDYGRGVHRAYRQSWDPKIIEEWHSSREDDPYDMIGRAEEEIKELTEHELFQIDEAMCTCTDREKLFFQLIRVDYKSFNEVAEIFGISKSTVQTSVERAEEKIKEQLEMNLFLIS